MRRFSHFTGLFVAALLLAACAGPAPLKLAPEIIDYLMRHAPRDMRTLSSFVDALDRYTLEHKRAVTLPLLRELLHAPHA